MRPVRSVSIAAHWAIAASRLNRTPFDDPAPRQEHETFFGFGQLDHEQLQALILSRLGRLIAGIPLIDKGDLHRISGNLLHLSCQFADLRSVLLVGRGNVQSQE